MGYAGNMGCRDNGLIAGISCYGGIEGVFFLNTLLVPGMAAAAGSLGFIGLVGLWGKIIQTGTACGRG